LQNDSARFEARLVTVQVNDSPSIFFRGMEGSRLPIPVAHGEGRASFETDVDNTLVALQYVDNYGKPTTQYPLNPNGSKGGVTGFTTTDGRVTIMMPHPERAFLTSQYSWHPNDWKENGPWLRMFQNARIWTEEKT
jgi:phosphoribosylformylglycinamidine synthase